MSLKYSTLSFIWQLLPSSFYNPEEGSKTIEGNILTLNPSLSEPDHIRFAAFTDPRINNKRHYQKFKIFLPEGFEMIAPPSEQNCFMYCLGIQRKKPMGRNEFDKELEKRGYECLDYHEDILRPEDIIVYSIDHPFQAVRRHAGIYQENGKVRSRWGHKAPLIEHPLEAVIDKYWSGEDKHLAIERIK